MVPQQGAALRFRKRLKESDCSFGEIAAAFGHQPPARVGDPDADRPAVERARGAFQKPFADQNLDHGRGRARRKLQPVGQRLERDSFRRIDCQVDYGFDHVLLADGQFLKRRHLLAGVAGQCVFTHVVDNPEKELPCLQCDVRLNLHRCCCILKSCRKSYLKTIKYTRNNILQILITFKIELFCFPIRRCGSFPGNHRFRTKNTEKTLEKLISGVILLQSDLKRFRDETATQ